MVAVMPCAIVNLRESVVSWERGVCGHACGKSILIMLIDMGRFILMVGWTIPWAGDFKA